MNNLVVSRELYLNWLAGAHPTVYSKTIQPVLKAAMNTRGRQPLGDWIDDLLSDSSSIPSLSVDSSSSGSSLWDNLLSSITSVGSTYVQTAAAKQLIDLNTQRVSQGLPPVDQNGNVITSLNSAAQSGNYLALQRWLAQQNSGVPSWVWIAGSGIVLLAIFMKN